MVALKAAVPNTEENPPHQTAYGLTSTKNFGGVTGARTTLFHPPANDSQTPQLRGIPGCPAVT
jgi:hypothetical protein